MAAKPQVKPDGSEDSHLEFSTITGFFLQDETRTDLGTFDMMSQNFGLIDQVYDTDSSLPENGRGLTPWQRFAHKLSILNEQAPNNESYRLLYLGRHGQGYHNIAESFYGTEAWDCYHSLLEADAKSPEVVFYDAHLTKLGIQQAQTISKFWSKLISTQHIPLPQSYYLSPLTRAIQTANFTFNDLIPSIKAAPPYNPIVKEYLREAYGLHTCDARPTKTYLTTTFPNLIFPETETFTEKDELYSAELREPDEVRAQRMLALLQDILGSDPSTYISFTFHSGAIASMLYAVGHRTFALPTGGAIPLLLKVTRTPGPGVPFDIHDRTNWEGKPTCRHDPLKAGKEGYKNIGEYVKEIERGL